MGGVNNSILVAVSREMILKQTGKDVSWLERNVSSFLTAFKIWIATTQKKIKSMSVFSNTIENMTWDKYTETNPGN